MTTEMILWVYIVLLFLGGLMGFIKAKSKASLIASGGFALVLSLFALNILPFRFHPAVLIFLLIFFGMRLAKSRKMMPNGVMLILTVAALALPLVLGK